jgi:hypothetical protein
VKRSNARMQNVFVEAAQSSNRFITSIFRVDRILAMLEIRTIHSTKAAG